MRISDWIKRKILSFTGVKPLTGNPNEEQFTLTGNSDDVIKNRLREYFVWYRGESDDLLDFFTGAEWSDFQKNPIFNRNKKDYFWVASAKEKNIKRTHSGIPRAIVDTLINAVGEPEVSCEAEKKILDEIMEENDMTSQITQKQMPYTLVGGWGAYKIDVDAEVSENPIISFYTADNVDFIYHKKRMIGIIFQDFYEYNDKKYVLFETRSTMGGNSYIMFDLFRIGRSNELFPCEKSEIPELSNLEDSMIAGLKKPLAVPTVFFDEVDRPGYGRSIYSGKVDLFDDLDQALSQSSNTVRKSTPVEYYPADMLERESNGRVKMPERYDRTFLPSPMASITGDGQQSGELKTTQPNLNFAQYTQEELTILSFILTGVLSPATMGIDIAKKDNADAQREKEKVTIMVRNNIIARQQKILKELYELVLIAKKYISNPNFSTMPKYDVSVSYGEFANPSFENQLQVLGAALNSGTLSPEKYVELLWGDSIGDEEKMHELEFIKGNQQQQAGSSMLDNLTNFEGGMPSEENEEKPKEEKEPAKEVGNE